MSLGAATPVGYTIHPANRVGTETFHGTCARPGIQRAEPIFLLIGRQFEEIRVGSNSRRRRVVKRTIRMKIDDSLPENKHISATFKMMNLKVASRDFLPQNSKSFPQVMNVSVCGFGGIGSEATDSEF
ncbi:UNVERIFIED_CONTAM: hypothetical protein Sradi_1969700 [Sesamum radiatum]|uniref:Uncharacterized protein n=1 Tax=Sesamum radiatum TaxID=300843 RepID=A0AAW2TF14_SESRA